ncbi:hypothetical protein AB0395_47755, partial [Streptosporangium sp. NPDC051023]
TMEAGRAIWGFPKEIADIDLRLSTPYKRCVARPLVRRAPPATRNTMNPAAAPFPKISTEVD